MKLKFMKQHNLDTLKENILYNKESYIEDENTWIYNFFNGQNPFEDFSCP